MTDSILDSTKKALGIASDYTAFDVDILMHINSTFGILNQLGIGPEGGFVIVDKDATWDTYLEGNLKLNAVKTYMVLRVRMFFDPPTTSFHLEAMNRQIQEQEFRLNVVREETEWVDPDPEPVLP